MELGHIAEVGLLDQTIYVKYLYNKVPGWFICEMNIGRKWEINATGPGTWEYTNLWE